MQQFGRFFIAMVFLLTSFLCLAWNALGHRLIGQIAYNHLRSDVKTRVDAYNHAMDAVYRQQTFVDSAPWMDSLRYVSDVWMKTSHYIDTPFSNDGTPLMAAEEPNAVTAITNAEAVLRNKHSTDYDKGFSQRILLHVIGDLHQPLHAADRYSQLHPGGDRGGNLFYLGSNSVANNLHAYWDNGGGFLAFKVVVDDEELRVMARNIEEKWPCDLTVMSNNSKAWSDESFQIAVDKAYSIKPYQHPDLSYQTMVQEVAQERIALAGCRLANVLNELESN